MWEHDAMHSHVPVPSRVMVKKSCSSTDIDWTTEPMNSVTLCHLAKSYVISFCASLVCTELWWDANIKMLDTLNFQLFKAYNSRK